VGIESTIVDLSGDSPAILRPAPSAPLNRKGSGRAARGSVRGCARSARSLPVHYAPRAKLQLVTRAQIIDALATNRGRRIAVLALEVTVSRLAPRCASWSRSYRACTRAPVFELRALDAAGRRDPGGDAAATPGWSGILDRLRRAASPPPRERKKQEPAAEESREG